MVRTNARGHLWIDGIILIKGLLKLVCVYIEDHAIIFSAVWKW